jgi:hypothetical protein
MRPTVSSCRADDGVEKQNTQVRGRGSGIQKGPSCENSTITGSELARGGRVAGATCIEYHLGSCNLHANDN